VARGEGVKFKLDPRFQGKKNQKAGEFGEAVVRRALERRGVKMVEKVNTPWKVLWRNGRPFHAFPVEKVSGDFIGIQAMTGRKVLVEVKFKDKGTFPYSMLEDHQIRALNENHLLGGISILALARGAKTQIHSWPISGFGPGKSLKWEELNPELMEEAT
jgi:penicillin-binding protein-related factor A (putative recombinase)